MLSLLIGLPLLGAALIGFWPSKGSPTLFRNIALAFALGILAWTVAIATQFDVASPGVQFQENLPWIPQLGLSYKLGIDGLSFPLLALSAFLNCIAIYGQGEAVERPRLYYPMIFLVNAGITGAFVAQNLLLFVLFYELELIPLYLLIGIWGGQKRGYAAMKFLIYTALSGILILAAFLGIAWLTHSSSFDIASISTENLSSNTQLILLTILLIGFGIKIPL
ncbi:MAG: proton-conducting transporter membrane subunit, partial [Planktothrix sp.]